MQSNRNHAEVVAENYYDSSDADNFYEKVWGGEDIHIGLYEPGDSIVSASRKTVQAMFSHLDNIKSDSKIIDLGAGYGGSARYLAEQTGCSVSCLNLSEIQNERNRKLTIEQGLQDKVTVLHGSCEDIPCEDNSQDIVWSQDAFLHSGKKHKVISEVARVLKPGGEVIFTDPMQADDCPVGVLQPVYDRLSLDSLSSIGFYRSEFGAMGFQEKRVLEMTHQLRNHYAAVKQELQDRYVSLTKVINSAYMDKMISGLESWITAADCGYLSWGILHFQKNIEG